MKAGMTFQFNDQTDFTLAETIMDCAFQEKFKDGEIEIVINGAAVGIAGKLSAEKIAETVPAGNYITFAAQMDDDEYSLLQDEVAQVNANLHHDNDRTVFYANTLSIAPR